MPKRLEVKSALVVANIEGGGVQYCYEGALLPENCDPDQVSMLLETGEVAEVDAPSEDKPVKTKAPASS